MTEIDWLSFNKGQILIGTSVIIAGLLGFILFGGAGCFYSILCTLCVELIWWAMG